MYCYKTSVRDFSSDTYDGNLFMVPAFAVKLCLISTDQEIFHCILLPAPLPLNTVILSAATIGKRALRLN